MTTLTLAGSRTRHAAFLLARTGRGSNVALEDGFDQVVAVCILGQQEDQGAAAQSAASHVLDSALRLDVPLFVDTRQVSDLGHWISRLFRCRLPRQPGQILAQNHGQRSNACRGCGYLAA